MIPPRLTALRIATQYCYIDAEKRMSHSDHNTAQDQPQDVVESIVPLMPIVLPIAGGVLIFLLAFIAVFMA